jgi:SAM-dependent methyltransferase
MPLVAELKRYARVVAPLPLKRWINERRDYRTMRSPDRSVLLERILPAFAARGGTILWVGCRRYTQTYPALIESRGAACSTLDIDPDVARFGHPARHVTGNLLDAERLLPRRDFDALLCNGVFGFGIDGPVAQRQALTVMSNLLAPGGWLMIGWNTDRVQDPIELASTVSALRPLPYGGLPQHIPVEGVTHVYDFFQRLP